MRSGLRRNLTAWQSTAPSSDCARDFTRGESAASIQNGHVRASIFGLVGSSVNLGGDLMSNENREFLEKLKFELAFIEDGGCRSRR